MSDDGIRGSGDRAVAAAAERAKQTAGRNIPVFGDLPVADTANLRQGREPAHDALLALLPLVGVCAAKARPRAAWHYRSGQQIIIVSHDGAADYPNWEARSWRLDEDGEYHGTGLRETGSGGSSTIRATRTSRGRSLLLAHSTGYVELFYGHPRTQSSWELVTDALARSKSGVLVGGAKRLYGIVDGGDLAVCRGARRRRRRPGAAPRPPG